MDETEIVRRISALVEDEHALERAHAGTAPSDEVAKGVEPGPYLLGEQFTAADVVVGSTLRWGLMFGLLPTRPEFMAYVGRLEQRPALQRATALDQELAAA